MKKILLSVSAAGLLALGSTVAHANPSSFFSDGADQDVVSVAVAGDDAYSESFNSPQTAISVNELTNTAATNIPINLGGTNVQGTGDVSWDGSAMQNFAGVNSQATNTAHAGAAQANSSVTAVSTAAFSIGN